MGQLRPASADAGANGEERARELRDDLERDMTRAEGPRFPSAQKAVDRVSSAPAKPFEFLPHRDFFLDYSVFIPDQVRIRTGSLYWPDEPRIDRHHWRGHRPSRHHCSDHSWIAEGHRECAEGHELKLPCRRDGGGAECCKEFDASFC